jgi:hypothetical protein
VVQWYFIHWNTAETRLLRLTVAASVTEPKKPGWLELANDAFYLIGSAVFQYM